MPSPSIGIPRKLSHIWIGPRPAPTAWMQTWQNFHPNWEYTLYDNKFLSSKKFKTQRQIDEYLKRGQYAGVADLMRLEILFEHGGLMPGADSVCLKSMEHLFEKKCAYAIYENEIIRGKLVSPIQAAEPGNSFIGKLIDVLSNTAPENLEEPWISTGNFFMTTMIDKFSPEIEIFPSRFMIPIHYTGICCEGSEPIYAIQKFGSTPGGHSRDGYDKASFLFRLLNLLNKRKMKRYNKERVLSARNKRIDEFKRNTGIQSNF